MGEIKYKSYHVDSPEYNGKPLELIKAKWEEFELGSIYLTRIYAGSMYLAFIQKYSHHTYGSVFIIAYALTNPIYARLINNVWTEQQSLITNTDLQARFDPIRIDGAKKNTFSSTLKDKCDNAVNFIAFAENAENPITDNPFSFASGYVIVFHSGLVRSKNVFTVIGVSADANAKIETKRLDLRS